MNTVFGDTYYFLALLNNTDQGHQKAVDFTNNYIGRLMTTGWVITELADALAYTQQSRAQFARTLQKLQTDSNMKVIPCEVKWTPKTGQSNKLLLAVQERGNHGEETEVPHGDVQGPGGAGSGEG